MAITLEGAEIFNTEPQAFAVEQKARRAIVEWLRIHNYAVQKHNTKEVIQDAGILAFRLIKSEDHQTPVVLVGLPSTFAKNPKISVSSESSESEPHTTHTSVTVKSSDDDHHRLIVSKNHGVDYDFSFTKPPTNHVETYTTASILEDGKDADMYLMSSAINVAFVGLRVKDGVHEEPIGSISIFSFAN